MNNIITTAYNHGFQPGDIIYIDSVCGKDKVTRWNRICRWLLLRNIPWLWVRKGARVCIVSSIVNTSNFEVKN